MTNMTMAIPEKIKKIMDRHPEIKWTQVARRAIETKAISLEKESDPWKAYEYLRWLEEGEDAEQLFEF